MWDQTAKDSRATHRVLRYDQRGHGQTEVTPGRYTFELLIADIIALMDALGIKKASWCGISMGGATAMGAVQKHPDRFDRLAICDTTGPVDAGKLPAMGSAHRQRTEERHAGRGGAHHQPLVSAGDGEG